MGVVWLVCLFFLASLGMADARSTSIQWDYPSDVQVNSFVLQVCRWDMQNCVWRDVQRLGPQRRWASVQVPDRGIGRCFQVWAIVGQRRGGPSNVLCLP